MFDGTMAYLDKDFANAAVNLQKALDAERQKPSLGRDDLRLLIVRTADANPDDHVLVENVERSAGPVAAPKRFLTYTLNLLRWILLLLFLGFFTSLAAFIIVSRITG